MSSLSPQAEELVCASRAWLQPNDADRERVFQGLLTRLGGSAGVEGMNGSLQAPAAASGTLVKVSTVLVGLGVAAAGLYFGLRPEPPPPRVSAAMPARPALVPLAPASETPASAAFAAPQAPSVAKRAPVAPRAADNLAQEVAILSRAGSELHAGRPAAALKALAEHQRRFPGGVLAEERAGARIQALCKLGRIKEARGELARLARTSPNSPHEARARRACGTDPAAKE